MNALSYIYYLSNRLILLIILPTYILIGGNKFLPDNSFSTVYIFIAILNLILIDVDKNNALLNKTSYMLPFTEKYIVKNKYLAHFGVLILAFILKLVIGYLFPIHRDNFDVSIYQTVINFFCGVLMSCILLVAIFKYDGAVARTTVIIYYVMSVFLLAFMIFGGLSPVLENVVKDKGIFIVAIPQLIIGCISIYASYRFSLKAFKNKDIK